MEHGRRQLNRKLSGKLLKSQNDFHALTNRFKGFSGGVGSGKSLVLCHEAVYLAFENPGTTGLIGAPTYGMLRDATMAMFLDICASRGMPMELNQSRMTIRFPEKDSTVIFRSMENPERLRGSNLAWFGVDELSYCREEAWTRLEARLRDPKATRLCGFGVWTPKGFDWLHRRFRESPVEGYGLVEAEPFENRFLPSDYYERLKVSYDPRFYEQEVLGKYLNTQVGRVYHAFDRRQNVEPCSLEHQETLLWSLDFNVNPMCSVIGVRRGDVIHIVDEIVQHTSSTPEVCEELVARYGRRRGAVRIYGDASGRQRHSASAYSDHQVIRKFFAEERGLKAKLIAARSNPPVRDRVNLVNSRLEAADGRRRLLIDPKCKELIKDLEQVSYKPDRGVIDKDRDPERTHLSDALGYLLWQEIGSPAQAGERSRPLF
ncbi:MAG: hypothetical protein GC160_19580 [Acidobacteria bacterium]|nr:hypothetical protein [Acidobacteriota bacterium]